MNKTPNLDPHIHKTRSIAKILSDAPGKLHTILSHVNELAVHTQLIRQYLPLPLKNHCQVAHVGPDIDRTTNQGILTIIVDSPIWATRLRYEVPELLQQLNNLPEMQHLHKVRIATNPVRQRLNADRTSTTPDISPGMSVKTSLFLENVADSTKNHELSKVIRRLSRHGHPKKYHT